MDKGLFEVMDAMEQINNDMHEQELKEAPRCHFRPMFRDMGDSTDGYYEEWWECSVCCHTKPLSRSKQTGEILAT